MPLTTPPLVEIELAMLTSIFSTSGLEPMVRFGVRGTLIEALAGPLMWTGVPVLERNVSSELTSVRFAAENVPCGRLPAINGSNFPEACVSSMRLLAGTVTTTGEPPPAGVSDSAETETSKAITLSAGASPKRTWAEDAPGPGVGAGLVTPDPPPPQPVARTSAATTMHASNNLITGANECWDFLCFILYISPGGGPSYFEQRERAQSAVDYSSFWALVMLQLSHLLWNNFLLISPHHA